MAIYLFAMLVHRAESSILVMHIIWEVLIGMHEKSEQRSIMVRLSEDDYNLLCKKADTRQLDKSNYIRYLIRKDRDDTRSKRAAHALMKISKNMEIINEDCNSCKGMGCEMKPFVCEMKKGVKELWHCLR